MKENIFDLQTDITNLIVKHGLQDGEFAFIYRDGKVMTIDLSQTAIQEAVENKINNISQDEQKEL